MSVEVVEAGRVLAFFAAPHIAAQDEVDGERCRAHETHELRIIQELKVNHHKLAVEMGVHIHSGQGRVTTSSQTYA
jgi:hypothetical protein